MGKYSQTLKSGGGKYSKLLSDSTFVQEEVAVDNQLAQSYGEQLTPGEAAKRTLFAPAELLSSAARDVESDIRNLPAGIIQAGRAMAQTPFAIAMSPISAAAKSENPILRFVGEGLEGVASLPYDAYLGLNKLVNKGVRALGIDPNLGLNPNNPNVRAINDLGGDIGTILATGGMIRGGRGAANIPKNVSRGLRSTARLVEIKAITPPFSAKKGLEVFERPVETAINFNLAPNKKSWNKLSENLESLEKSSLNIAKNSGAVIDLKRMNDVIDAKLGKLKNNPQAPEITAGLEDIRSRINNIASKYPNSVVPLSAAIELKRGLQKIAKGKYDETGIPKAEAAKLTAYELLNDIVEAEPNLRQIGQQQQRLIELGDVLERKIAQHEKRPPVTWADVRATAIGSGVGFATNPFAGLVIGGALELSTRPNALHRIAIGLDRLGGGRKTPLATGGIRSNFPPPPNVGGQPPPPFNRPPVVGGSPTAPPPFNRPPVVGGSPTAPPPFAPSPVDATFTPPVPPPQLGNSPVQRGNLLPEQIQRNVAPPQVKSTGSKEIGITEAKSFAPPQARPVEPPKGEVTLYRSGNFFESIGNDADIVGSIIGVGKIKHKKYGKLAGIVQHGMDEAIKKLEEAGYKVNIKDKLP
jgi:hypothetical protein